LSSNKAIPFVKINYLASSTKKYGLIFLILDRLSKIAILSATYSTEGDSYLKGNCRGAELM